MTAHDARPSPLTRQAGGRRAAVLATALLLAGCGSSEPSRPHPSPETAAGSEAGQQASPSADASGAPTGDYPVPAAATAHTQEGAKQFAEFYARALGESLYRAYRALVDRYATPECMKCRDFGDYVDGVEEDDRRTEVNGYQDVTAVEVIQGGDAVGRVFVRAHVKAPETWDVSLTTGKRVGKSPAERAAFVMAVEWTEGGWRIAELRGEM